MVKKLAAAKGERGKDETGVVSDAHLRLTFMALQKVNVDDHGSALEKSAEANGTE